MFTEATKKALAFLDDELAALRRENLYRDAAVLATAQKPRSKINGRNVVNLSSNNYLGLTTHPKVTATAIRYAKKWGAGTAAVRSIIGTMKIHNELEEKIAKFKGTEASLVFQSGFTTNVAVNQTLMTDESDYIISDQLNHASIIDGARLSKAKRYIYKHKDMADLENGLKQAAAEKARRILVVTDGVFSMDGDVAPLPDIITLCEKFGAMLMVDDAHATGVLGKGGRGTPNHFGLTDRVHIQIGTLSKAVGSVGGYVSSTRSLRQYFSQRARPFIFSSSHPPYVVGTCSAAIDILMSKEGEKLINKLWDNTKYFKERLKEMGINTGRSETPITPIIVGNTPKAMQMCDDLLKEGVFALAIGFPTVARGTERLRTIVTATHTRADLDHALNAIKKVATRLGVISADGTPTRQSTTA